MALPLAESSEESDDIFLTAMQAMNNLLETLVGGKSVRKDDKEHLAIISYEHKLKALSYIELQIPIKFDFMPRKKTYPDFTRLKQVEQSALDLYLNTRVDR